MPESTYSITILLESDSQITRARVSIRANSRTSAMEKLETRLQNLLGDAPADIILGWSNNIQTLYGNTEKGADWLKVKLGEKPRTWSGVYNVSNKRYASIQADAEADGIILSIPSYD